jgi:membrane protease YdiL (CAAX protease family)
MRDRKVLTYLALTFGFSTFFYVPILRAGTLAAGGGLCVLGLMWSPATAAMVTQLLFERSLAGLGWRPGRARWLLAGALLPVAYAALAYGAVWALGLGGFPEAEFAARLAARYPFAGSAGGAIAAYFGVLATAGLATSLLSAAGEEIGWRGLLFPRLVERLGVGRATLATAGVWFVYHLPLILFADYRGGAPLAWSLACFAALVLGGSFLFGWARLRSGSLWPAALLHASHNVFVQGFFDPATADRGATAWWIGEFGLALPLAIAAVTCLCWWRWPVGGPPPAAAASELHVVDEEAG